MRTRKLLQETLKALGISREELEHWVTCSECVDPFDAEQGWFCEDYKRWFQGWTPRSPLVSPITLELQQLWSQEILRQVNSATPGFRYKYLRGDSGGNEET